MHERLLRALEHSGRPPLPPGRDSARATPLPGPHPDGGANRGVRQRGHKAPLVAREVGHEVGPQLHVAVALGAQARRDPGSELLQPLRPQCACNAQPQRASRSAHGSGDLKHVCICLLICVGL